MITLARAHDCDLCKRPAAELPTIYDARLQGGGWAWVCEMCFNAEGVGLGVGNGQKFDNQTNGKKLAGIMEV